ncbi:MAG: tetratricopeptide repeat protein [Candidatus Polarisedimenticolia bacterium]
MTAIKFGKDFELDPRAYELRRGGRPVALARIPMEILLLLVEHRPDLVTREQIIEKIWGQGVFVDTNNSINGAIRKLRQALRDDPESPRLIATVTGKGYRFIAPILAGESEEKQVAGNPVEVVPAPIEEPARSQSPAQAERPARERMPARARWLAAVGVLAAVGAYFLWPRLSSDPPKPGRTMLAVLPFINLTGDPDQEYFSDGLTEEMITRVANLSPGQLEVIARTSVMQYKKPGTPLDQLSRELGVQYVLEGSVRRDSENVRITAQLIRIKDQTHLWARQYDRKPSEVLAVQAEIAQAIADQIGLTFGQRPPPAPTKTPLSPEEIEAYEEYLKGRFFWNKRTKEGFLQAIDAFQRAIARNPRDARSYAGLADTYVLMGTWGYAPHTEVVPKAREAARKALQVDDKLAAPHAALALVSMHFDFDWQSAESQFRRAIELDSSYATAHHWYAECLAWQGRFAEAFAEIDRARQLDPLSLIIAVDRAVLLTYARDFDGAIEQFRSVLAKDPNFPRAHNIVGAYMGAGRYAEALAHLEEWHKTDDGPYFWAATAAVYGRAGRLTEARQAFANMEASNRSAGIDPLFLCANRAELGDLDEFFACMEKACEVSPAYLIPLKVSASDPVRNDPRFRDVLRCVNLTP